MSSLKIIIDFDVCVELITLATEYQRGDRVTRQSGLVGDDFSTYRYEEQHLQDHHVDWRRYEDLYTTIKKLIAIDASP